MDDHALSDKEILEKSIEQPRYFEILIDRYQEAFLRKSMVILHSKEEAEDIVQETFLKIYKYARKFKHQEGASFKSWAYKILINTSYTHYKRQKINRATIELVDFSEYDVEDTSLDTLIAPPDERRGSIERILSLMPSSFAKILRLYFLEEKSQKEIAQIEHISPALVRTRIHRAKKYFKDISLRTI